MTATCSTFCRYSLLAGVIVLSTHLLCAQEGPVQFVAGPDGKSIAMGPDGKPIMGPDGKPIVMGPDGKPIIGGMSGAPPTTGPHGPKSPGPPGKPGEGAKPGEPPKPIQRPAKPETPPDPKEFLKAEPDKKGMFKFTFNGQPWLPVLQWLADHSNMSLDWQEVPGDYLNIRLQHSYTIRQVRGLINRHLLDRGYTLLCEGESMKVAKIENLDAALVPRVDPKELDRCDPYEFVKVLFPLDGLTAETAARELTPMMKSNRGKLTPMIDINCVEAMGTVVNLLEIREVLKREQSIENQRRSWKKFNLHYARAEDVRDELQALVGGEAKSVGRQPQQNSEESQRAAMMRAMQQQAQQGGQPGQPGQPPGAAAAAKIPTAFVVNARENSILVSARPTRWRSSSR